MEQPNPAPPSPFSEDEQHEISQVVKLLDELRERTGPLNAPDLRAYARRLKRCLCLTVTMAHSQDTFRRGAEDLLQKATDQNIKLKADLARTFAQAQSWNPLPYLRRQPLTRWVPLVWDHTAAAVLRALLRLITLPLGSR